MPDAKRASFPQSNQGRQLIARDGASDFEGKMFGATNQGTKKTTKKGLRLGGKCPPAKLHTVKKSGHKKQNDVDENSVSGDS